MENKFSVTPSDNIAAHRISALQDEADALTRQVPSQVFLQKAPTSGMLALRWPFISFLHVVYQYDFSEDL